MSNWLGTHWGSGNIREHIGDVVCISYQAGKRTGWQARDAKALIWLIGFVWFVWFKQIEKQEK